MKKVLGWVFICMLALPMAALSQAPPPEERIELSPWWDRPVVRNLGLSQEQIHQIRAIVGESRDQLIQLRANVKIAEGHLTDAMNEEVVSDEKAANAISEVAGARVELMRATSEMSVKIRKVLTFKQWQELRKRGANRVVNTLERRQRARAGR
jgi:Spy/CpxP family protein refolding chaperone